MSVADRDGIVEIQRNDGSTASMPYRAAAGLVSRGRATFVPDKPKRRRAKRKTSPTSPPSPAEPTMPDAAPTGQDVDIAENKPHDLL